MSRGPHWNQPGGRHRESRHRNVAGRERELRAMADAVRRLVRITTENAAGPEETAAAAARIGALADELEAHVPASPPSHYGAVPEDPEAHDVFPYDIVLGIYNPLALPVEMTWEPPRAVGHARFDGPYEGPPGCVHGAVLAAVFDQVLNIANLMSGTVGPTANLSLEYRRPTPLHEPLVFEAWIESVMERKIRTVGHVRFGDYVCVEASGLFIQFDPAQSMRLQEL